MIEECCAHKIEVLDSEDVPAITIFGGDENSPAEIRFCKQNIVISADRNETKIHLENNDGGIIIRIFQGIPSIVFKKDGIEHEIIR